MAPARKHPQLDFPTDYLARYPRICAHIIAESLGYATPSLAAKILQDAHRGEANWCEWIAACYRCDPRPALQKAIKNRHHHEGYMASYRQALQIVRHAIDSGDEPLFASWF